MDVRLVSDRYIKEPLKARTRYVTKLVIQIRYCLLLLNPYSYIDTKHDLTVYLAEKSKIEFGEIHKKCVITYDATDENKLTEFPKQLQTHDHKETDTLMILHCWYLESVIYLQVALYTHLILMCSFF